jgi:hypothetical protein
MLTATKGGTCTMLGEDCCFWVNRLGQVQTNIYKLTYQASQLREQVT